VFGGLDRGGKGREKGNVTLRGLCVDSRLCYGDWIGVGKGREKGNVTLRGLCVDSRFC